MVPLAIKVVLTGELFRPTKFMSIINSLDTYDALWCTVGASSLPFPNDAKHASCIIPMILTVLQWHTFNDAIHMMVNINLMYWLI
jgi:hypothetical protein